MERLTCWFGNGTCRVAGMAEAIEEKYTTDELIDMLLDRLGAYEDTGMEPEEINQLREFCESATNTTLRHIYELVQAEKDGRLVVMAPAYTVEPPKLNMDPAQLPNLITSKTLKALERMGAKAHRGE